MSVLSPIYIISKNRAESRLTSKTLEKMSIPYKIIVEEFDYPNYAKYIDKEKILILPEKYLNEYDTCDNLGRTKSTGPGAARNFCWDNAVSNGFKWHWVMDDNIRHFGRYNNNSKIIINTPQIFIAMEDFVNRYENVVIAGPNYQYFIARKRLYSPLIFNTRIYSCLLIRNNIPYRWRGRYNEDTDLCLRVLKDGLCTVQFNAFLQYKAPTQTTKGGCNQDFYEVEGTLNKSKMLVKMHPDITHFKYKFDRWHHTVHYQLFKKNILIKKENIKIPTEINNYNMKLIHNI